MLAVFQRSIGIDKVDLFVVDDAGQAREIVRTSSFVKDDVGVPAVLGPTFISFIHYITPVKGDMSTEEGHGKDLTRSPSTTPPLPRPPEPENDKAIVPPIKSPVPDDDAIDTENLDIFTLKPLAALKLLSRSVDGLVQATGDVPPTPPPRSRCPSPTPSGAASSPVLHSSSLRNETTTPSRKESLVSFGVSPPEHIDGVPFVKTPIGSPEAQAHDYPTPGEDIGARAQPSHVQHGLIARKFWSKRPPPITLEDYLLRLHKFCPMSAAVYLATNHYIQRLAVHDRLVPVTPRNVHRLVLAGLRVAMKALEDLSWPHGRFSKVGGVSESELSRLEVTFCFLMDFSLKVDPETLQKEAQMLAGRVNASGAGGASGTETAVVVDSSISGGSSTKSDGEINRPKSRSGEKRKASSTLPSRPAFHALAPGGNGGIEVAGHG
ncbi:hypothetical protein DV736_g2684, partial [Chaetothyriales sp. CBS 134916]